MKNINRKLLGVCTLICFSAKRWMSSPDFPHSHNYTHFLLISPKLPSHRIKGKQLKNNPSGVWCHLVAQSVRSEAKLDYAWGPDKFWQIYLVLMSSRRPEVLSWPFSSVEESQYTGLLSADRFKYVGTIGQSLSPRHHMVKGKLNKMLHKRIEI